jgi:hypothetical protein
MYPTMRRGEVAIKVAVSSSHPGADRIIEPGPGILEVGQETRGLFSLGGQDGSVPVSTGVGSINASKAFVPPTQTSVPS